MRMNKVDMTFCELADIIDENIENDISTHIVCDGEMKDLVADYLYEDFGLEDTNEEYYKGEYYIEIYYTEDGLKLSIESAKGNSGKYKYCEYDGKVEYYIFTDMSISEVDKYLQGELATCVFCEFISCEECDECDEFEEYEEDLDLIELEEDCDGDCENCPYADADDDAELEYITNKVNELINCGMCPDCAFEFVIDLYEIAYDNGFEDFRLGMIEDLLTEDED